MTDSLSAQVQDARQRTLQLLAGLDAKQLMGPRMAIVNPLRWEIGHTAYFYEYWILRQHLGESPILPEADALYDSISIAHETRWDLPLPADAERYAAQHTDAAQPTVVISPCSSQRSRNFRNWSIDNYAAIIRYLQEQHQCRVLLTGGNSDLEKEYAQALCDDATPGLENLVGRSTLPELAALIRAADLVICPDSGPAHIATAVGTSVLGLYATSNPARTGPYLSQHLTANRYPDAARKYLGKAVNELRWGQRVRHPEAMDLITIDDVKGKIDDFFANSR